MSGLFGSTTIKGNRITEFAAQTSAVGRTIPFGYGRFLVESCNVIWVAGKPKEHLTKKKQGKGGVKTEEYSYTQSYAIAVCRGPIYGYLTIKRDGKVVYTTDPTATIEDQAYAAKWAQKVRFYYGTADQMPDPTIESVVGAGKVSAFRDLAYFSVTDEDVTAGGGAVPQYQVVVVASPPDVFITSRPYHLYSEDGLLTNTELHAARSREDPVDDTVFDIELLDGSLREVVQRLSTPAEEVAMGIQLLGGELKTMKVTYTAPNDNLLDFSIALQSGSLITTLVRYQNWPAEPLDFNITLLDGTLS